MCTGIRIKAVNGDIFFGRTMDLAMPMFGEDNGAQSIPSSLISIPTGTHLASQLTPWDAKYATMGMGVTNSIILYDGINEHGLAGDTQVLIESTRKPAAEFDGTTLTPVLAEEFVTYILTQYASVAEIRDAYQNLALIDHPFVFDNQTLSFPLHYTFVDPTGDGVVLEPVNNGEFKIYDFIGVVTNSPEYNYHTTNIRQYIGLRNLDLPQNREINEHTTLTPIERGTGYGLVGMPGDYTSPARFIRSFYYSNFMDAFQREDGIANLYAAFRPVIIPRGLEHPSEDNPLSDFTRYWAGYDLTERTIYVQSARGLAFTAKTLDPSLTTITYEAIDLTNHVHSLNK